MILHFSIEEKPFLPRGEGEADSASPASDERNSQWRSGLLSGLNPLQTMLLLTHSLLLFQGGGDCSWLIYEALQLGVRRIWRPSYQKVIPASPDPNCNNLFLVSKFKSHGVPRKRMHMPGPLQTAKAEFQGEAQEAVF